jgi:hypothetical protein
MTRLTNIAMIVLLTVLATAMAGCHGAARTVEVFHKDKPPSLKTLERTKVVLDAHDDCEVAYYLITDPENAELIRKYNLPDGHFPFAVVIDGKYSAAIDGRTVHFIEFPLFMKGIGRHEGNWSMDDLDRVLRDTSLLLSKNVLPKSFDHHDDEPCPGEEE